MRLTALALAAALCLGPGAAWAGEGAVVISARDGSARSLDARPTERSVATFRDVLRAVSADTDTAADGAALAGPAEIDLPEGGASFAVISEGERDHVAMTVSGMLIMAEVAPEFRPAGALPVRTRPDSEPTIAQMLLLGEGRPAAVIVNGRDQEQESFARHLIATPVEGRLREVFQGPRLHSVDTFERGCEPRRVEQRMLPLALREAPGEGYGELSMTVRVARICIRRGRPRTLGTVIHHARLRWDPAQARYLGGMAALERRNARRPGSR